jgi:endonuclease/exonuclease/phosphatase (EEP) superfamily protein YafD
MGLALLIGLAGLTAIVIVVTLAPYVHFAHGLIRICAFPRLQIAAVALALGLLTYWLVDDAAWRWGLIAAQAAAIAVQLGYVAKFTPLWWQQTRSHDGPARGGNTVGILSVNVKMSNRQADRVLSVAETLDPDIMVFMETDARWAGALQPLRERWPFGTEHPLDNSYGMLLFSRYELEELEVECLVTEGVPSISAKVVLPDGARFRLFAVHPEPPVPYATTVGRDAELLVVGRAVAEADLPCIVTGDLNDVAWSHTTRRFQRETGLLDPRVGRGLFNTFDARYPVLRWPLDHLFHDRRFALIEMRRGAHVGSDHFPMFFRLALTSDTAVEDAPDPPTRQDKREKDEIIAEAKARDSKPIGEDWED